MSKIRQRISEIDAERFVLAQEREMLQRECPHDKYEVQWFSWRIGAKDLRRICVDCSKVVGNPSEEEMTIFNNQ